MLFYLGEVLLNKLSKAIKFKRKVLMFTQEEVCHKVYETSRYILSQNQLSKFENGRAIPNVQLLNTLCSILQIDWDEIKHLFLNESLKQNDLLELFEESTKRNDFLFSSKVAAKLIPSIKHDRPLLTKIIFQLTCRKPLSERIKSRLDQFFISQLSSLSTNNRFKALEELYFISKKAGDYQLLIFLLKTVSKAGWFEKQELFTIYYQLSTAYYFHKNYLDALIESNRAEEMVEFMDPNNPMVLYLYWRMGNICVQLSFYEKAILYYKQVLSFLKESNEELKLDVFYNIGYSYYKRKQYDLATSYWDKLIKKGSNNNQLIYVLPDYCFMELLRGNIKKAKELYQKAKEIFQTQSLNKDELVQLAIHLRNKAIFHLLKNELSLSIDELKRSILMMRDSIHEEELKISKQVLTFILGKELVNSQHPMISIQDLREMTGFTFE